MKRVLLTGASGFVGSHVLRHILATTDWEVVCLVSFRHRGLTDRIRLAVAGYDEGYERVTVLTHDLTAPISVVLAREIGPVDYVINVASESHVDRSIEDPAPFIQNNVALMTTMLDYARTTDIDAFLHVSTDEVYGPAPDGHAHQEWVDGHFPSNPYSASKAAQEAIAFAYWRTYGVPLIITNTMNIVGEMQDPEKFVPMVIRRVLLEQEVPIHASADGAIIGSRFYLHARNQADGLLHALTQPVLAWGDSDYPQRFHIVGEREVDNLGMAQMVAEYVGKPLRYDLVDFHSSRPGHDLRYALDGTKIAATGWRAPYSLEQSLARTVRWTLAHPEWLDL
jgi:dTDP-glucose 4,6-dehydratase